MEVSRRKTEYKCVSERHPSGTVRSKGVEGARSTVQSMWKRGGEACAGR